MTKILYYPSLTKSIKLFYGIKFQASTDNIIYLDLFTLNENIKTGWNTWSSNQTLPLYRYIRFIGNSTSRCNIAEIQLYGLKSYTGVASLTNTTCNALVQLNSNKYWLNSSVIYSQNSTPIVFSIAPSLGPTSGGTLIIVNGSGFGVNASKVNVLLDNVICVINTINDTIIICTSGPRY